MPPTGQDFIPQDMTMALTFTPQVRVILGVYYPDGNHSGGWRCVP